jgi:hypothetical protein
MLGVGLSQKRALVMIKPPRDLGRAGILEIDDGVLIAVELLLVKQGARPVDKASELEFRITANALAVKAGKQCSRGRSIKALIVIENANSQMHSPLEQNSRAAASSNQPAGEKLIGLTA